MGVTAAFTIVPAKLFNREKTYCKPGATLPEKVFDIDKVWDDFHSVLRELPAPLSYAILGQFFREIEFEDFDDLIFVSPALVKKIDASLKRFSEKEMIVALKNIRRVSRYSNATYHRENFKILKKVYRMAAKQKAGLAVCIG